MIREAPLMRTTDEEGAPLAVTPDDRVQLERWREEVQAEARERVQGLQDKLDRQKTLNDQLQAQRAEWKAERDNATDLARNVRSLVRGHQPGVDPAADAQLIRTLQETLGVQAKNGTQARGTSR